MIRSNSQTVQESVGLRSCRCQGAICERLNWRGNNYEHLISTKQTRHRFGAIYRCTWCLRVASTAKVWKRFLVFGRQFTATLLSIFNVSRAVQSVSLQDLHFNYDVAKNPSLRVTDSSLFVTSFLSLFCTWRTKSPFITIFFAVHRLHFVVCHSVTLYFSTSVLRCLENSLLLVVSIAQCNE